MAVGKCQTVQPHPPQGDIALISVMHVEDHVLESRILFLSCRAWLLEIMEPPRRPFLINVFTGIGNL